MEDISKDNSSMIAVKHSS